MPAANVIELPTRAPRKARARGIFLTPEEVLAVLRIARVVTSEPGQ